MSKPLDIGPDLLKRVREGEEPAWRELIDHLNPLVLRIIRSQVRKVSEHDDLAQEAFTKIFLKLDQFAGHQPFAHWVSRLTINTCYDWLRRQRARPLVSYADLGETQAEIVENNLRSRPEKEGTDLAAMRELLDRLIATLKPREQIVIRLLDLEEKSVAETCDLTGWGSSKVKVTAMRARRKLRDHLAKLNSDQS